MTTRSTDWRHVTRGLLIPSVTFVVAVSLLVVSWLYHGRLEGQYRRMTVDQGTVNSEYEAFVVRKRLLERYHRRYEAFRERGFIDRERRVDLLEVLREVGEDIGLPALRYTLEPQRSLSPPASLSGGAIELHASALQLEIGLLHELDLLRLLHAVRARAPGLLSVNRCALIRQGDAATPSTVDTNVGASCTIRVFSVTTSDVATGMAAL